MSGATSRLVVRGVIAALVVGAAVWFFASGDFGDENADGTGGPQGATGTMDPACHSLHEGHAAMAWNPTAADEMVEADCGWPYEPYLTSTEGGEEDPGIDAAFEPRLYQKLSEAIGETGLGFCSVNTLPEDPGDGFVFGFRYDAAEPGCPELTATVELTAREYVTRAHRDAAAHALDDPEVIVLGRWVIQVAGTDQAGVEDLASRLIDLGGQPMGPR